ncbi:MAG: hypothetical protein ABWK01_03125 [Infirmifilum sp.]
MQEENVCKYYRQTARGARCIFIGAAEWKAVSEKYLQFCKSGGAGCPVLASIGKKMANHSSFRKGGVNVLFRED